MERQFFEHNKLVGVFTKENLQNRPILQTILLLIEFYLIKLIIG